MIELIQFGRRWWREILIVALVLLVGNGVARWKASIAREAVAAQQLHVADSTLAVLVSKYSADSAKLARDSIAADSAVALWQAVAAAARTVPSQGRAVARVDTLVQQVVQHDTTHWIDTVTRQPTRAEILQAGDQLAHACQELQNSCAQTKADLLAKVAALESDNAALRSVKAPPEKSCTEPVIVSSVLSAAAGYAAGKNRVKLKLGSFAIP